MPTGIGGFDALLGGGLPRGRTTLVVGGPGCGKTLFSLQALACAAQRGEPGVFVGFEESTGRILSNARSFGWGLDALARSRLFFLDARLSNAVVVGGEFDLLALFSIVAQQVKRLGAKWIVLDGIDTLLSFLNDPVMERREMHRLSEWLSEQKLTAIITCKSRSGSDFKDKDDYLQFLADCVVVLQHQLIGSLPLRLVRVTKCRGLAHASGEVPFAITPTGLKVVSYGDGEEKTISNRRVSTGIDELDEMLGGGYFEGTTVLVSGSPGTAKSTLAGAFIEAAAARGEPSLYVTFDEPAAHVVRNMASVDIQLEPHVKSGLLHIMSERKVERSPVEHVARIVEVIEKYRVKSLVIDPVSSLTAFGVAPIAEELVLRLLDYARSRGVTVLCTTMLSGGNGLLEETGTGVSTIPDTWIHLSYIIRNGERNRALTIVKSRGIGHSKQVRELVLSDAGATLANVYAAGGDVLMGTMRRQKESEQHQLLTRAHKEGVRKQRDAEVAIAEATSHIASLNQQLRDREAALREMISEEAPAPPPGRHPERSRR
jgi:circadian clock protein KaiC